MSSTRAPGLHQQLGGEVPLLGELRVVERLFGMFEIGAAVLPVGIEEQAVKLPVEVVVMRHVAARALRRIELGKAPPDIAQQPLRFHPARRLAARVLRHREREEIRDRAALDHESSVHVGFADREFGVEQHGQFGEVAGKTDRNGFARSVAKFHGRSARRCQAQRSVPDERPQQRLAARDPSAAPNQDPSDLAVAAERLGPGAASIRSTDACPRGQVGNTINIRTKFAFNGNGIRWRGPNSARFGS